MRRTAPACESRGHPLSQKFVPAPLGEEPRLNQHAEPQLRIRSRAFWGGARLRPPQNARLRLKFGSAPRSARGAGGSAPSEEPPARRAGAGSILPTIHPPRGAEEPGSALGSSRELGPLPRGRTGCAGFVHPSHPTYLPTRTMIDAPTATRATTEKLKSTLLTPLWHGERGEHIRHSRHGP